MVPCSWKDSNKSFFCCHGYLSSRLPHHHVLQLEDQKQTYCAALHGSSHWVQWHGSRPGMLRAICWKKKCQKSSSRQNKLIELIQQEGEKLGVMLYPLYTKMFCLQLCCCVVNCCTLENTFCGKNLDSRRPRFLLGEKGIYHIYIYTLHISTQDRGHFRENAQYGAGAGQEEFVFTPMTSMTCFFDASTKKGVGLPNENSLGVAYRK